MPVQAIVRGGLVALAASDQVPFMSSVVAELTPSSSLHPVKQISKSSSTGRLTASPTHMLAEETFHGAVELEPVLLVLEAVPLVVFDQVLDIDVALAQRIDDLI